MSDDLADALDALEDVINQACQIEDGTLDSMALSAYANGMRVLAKHGLLVITAEHGRRVLGYWPPIQGRALDGPQGHHQRPIRGCSTAFAHPDELEAVDG